MKSEKTSRFGGRRSPGTRRNEKATNALSDVGRARPKPPQDGARPDSLLESRTELTMGMPEDSDTIDQINEAELSDAPHNLSTPNMSFNKKAHEVLYRAIDDSNHIINSIPGDVAAGELVSPKRMAMGAGFGAADVNERSPLRLAALGHSVNSQQKPASRGELKASGTSTIANSKRSAMNKALQRSLVEPHLQQDLDERAAQSTFENRLSPSSSSYNAIPSRGYNPPSSRVKHSMSFKMGSPRLANEPAKQRESARDGVYDAREPDVVKRLTTGGVPGKTTSPPNKPPGKYSHKPSFVVQTATSTSFVSQNNAQPSKMMNNTGIKRSKMNRARSGGLRQRPADEHGPKHKANGPHAPYNTGTDPKHPNYASKQSSANQVVDQAKKHLTEASVDIE